MHAKGRKRARAPRWIIPAPPDVPPPHGPRATTTLTLGVSSPSIFLGCEIAAAAGGGAPSSAAKCLLRPVPTFAAPLTVSRRNTHAHTNIPPLPPPLIKIPWIIPRRVRTRANEIPPSLIFIVSGCFFSELQAWDIFVDLIDPRLRRSVRDRRPAIGVPHLLRRAFQSKNSTDRISVFFFSSQRFLIVFLFPFSQHGG